MAEKTLGKFRTSPISPIAYEAAPAFDPALVVNRNGLFHED
jgi:hypothetical protein